MKKLTMAVASVLALFSANAFADATCTPLMNDLLAYAQVAPASCNTSYNTVSVQMTTNRNDMRYVSFAEGVLYKKKSGLDFVLTGDATQQFSDRSADISVPNTSPGGFTIPVWQNFSVKKQDSLGLTLDKLGTISYVLKSWGNAKATVGSGCINNMLYGIQNETIFLLSFKKTKATTGPC
jgi:hypothetical protein